MTHQPRMKTKRKLPSYLLKRSLRDLARDGHGAQRLAVRLADRDAELPEVVVDKGEEVADSFYESTPCLQFSVLFQQTIIQKFFRGIF